MEFYPSVQKNEICSKWIKLKKKYILNEITQIQKVKTPCSLLFVDPNSKLFSLNRELGVTVAARNVEESH